MCKTCGSRYLPAGVDLGSHLTSPPPPARGCDIDTKLAPQVVAVALSSSDCHRVAAFYRASLGWRSGEGGGVPGADGGVVLPGSANRPLGRIVPRGMNTLLDAAGWAPFFTVPDAKAAAQRIIDQGGDVVDFAHITKRVAVLARDRFGAVFGLLQHSPDIVIVQRVHAELAINDMDAAADFYRPVLGADILLRAGDVFDYRALVYGEVHIGGLINLGEFDKSGAGPRWMPYFPVDDVDKLTSRAIDLGAVLRIPPANSPFDRYAVLADPQGGLFGISNGPALHRADFLDGAPPVPRVHQH